MPAIEFIKPYKFAHRGHITEAFEPGQVVEADAELARCAIADKVAKPHKAAPRKTPETAAARSAPEVKA